MIKTIVYGYREDEDRFFRYYSEKMGIELVRTGENATLENASLAEGCDQVAILSDMEVTRPMLEVYKKGGVKLLTTRTIGADHIDLGAAADCGIAVSRITYSPYSVAD